jgi:hypothetical protein
MRSRTIVLFVLGAPTLAACASTPAFTLPAAEIQRAYDAAPWDDQPGDSIISPSEYSAASCRMQTRTRAVCRYRYSYGQGAWHTATQALERLPDGAWAWVFL